MSERTRQTILETVKNSRLFEPWFRDRWFKKGGTWNAWFTFLATLFGLPMTETDLLTFQACTGLTVPPAGGANEAWLIVGRRGGKSLILALTAAYLATIADWSAYLNKGERGVVMIAAADRDQAKVLFRYVKSFISDVKALHPLIARETQDSIDLKNGISIEVATASFKSIRGRTVIAFLADELAFWSVEGSNPDKEVLAAIRPAMATVPGAMLLVASSPYAQRGELFHTFRKHYGKPGPALVWKADTRTMNPSVPDRVIAEAYERDPASAAAEYGAEFRTDVESFVPSALVESLVVQGRIELAPSPGFRYSAFCDPAGGSGADSMVLAIAHQDPLADCFVLDAIREMRPPFSPQDAVAEFVALLETYGITSVTGDHWGGLFVRQPFDPITYLLAKQTKSDIYRDTLALLNSRRVQLLDNPRLVQQLCGLERRTGRGGRDSIDHGPGQHDDVANAVAGAILLASNADQNRIIWSMAFANSTTPVFSSDNAVRPMSDNDLEWENKRRAIVRNGNIRWDGKTFEQHFAETRSK